MIQLLDLNYDCLLHMFGFLDIGTVVTISGTCKRLSDIAEIVSQKHTFYKCIIGAKVEALKEAGNIIRKIGQRLTKLDLTFCMTDPTSYFQNVNGRKFLSLLNSSIGENIHKLSIRGEVCSIPFSSLAPTLAKLEKLAIYQCPETLFGHTILDLPVLCPNLQTLIIDNCGFIFAPNPMKSFDNLEVLKFASMGGYYPDDLFVSFIEQNKQLKRLYIDALRWFDEDEDDGDLALLDSEIDMSVITNNLKNLEVLRIRTIFFDNMVQGITDMKGLNRLTTLVISEFWEDVEQFNQILNILKTMKQLKNLWIGDYTPTIANQQSIIDIADELKELESFKSHIEWELETIVKFIRRGQSLKMLSVELRRSLVVTPKFIKDIAEVRQSIAGTKHQPLVISFDAPKFNDDVIQVFEEPVVRRFLKFEPTCNFDFAHWDFK